MKMAETLGTPRNHSVQPHRKLVLHQNQSIHSGNQTVVTQSGKEPHSLPLTSHCNQEFDDRYVTHRNDF